MSLTLSSRIHCYFDYDDDIVSLKDILKLGISYKPFQSTDDAISFQSCNERFKYRPDQRVEWASLPAEVRTTIYEHVYTDVYKTRNLGEAAMNIYSMAFIPHTGEALPTWTSRLPDDDVIVILPHVLADRLVSKQWLLETAHIITNLRPWCLTRCEGRAWRFALQTFGQPWTDSAKNLSSVDHCLCSMQFSYSHCVHLLNGIDSNLADHFDLKHFFTCNPLRYISVSYPEWQNELFLMRGSNVDGSLNITTVKSGAATLRDEVYALPSDTADTLVQAFCNKRSQDFSRFPENIRTSIANWASENTKYLAFKVIFDQWHPTYQQQPEFCWRISCMIEGNSEEALAFNLRMQANGKIHAHAFASQQVMQYFKDIQKTKY